MINESLHLGMSVFVVPLYPAQRDLFNEWQLHVIPLSQGMKGRKNIVWIFVFFPLYISNGIQKRRPRQLNSGGNQFDVVISSIQPPGRIKRSFVLCYKPLPNLCKADTLAALRGGSWGQRTGVCTMQWPCQVCRACRAPAQLVLGFPHPTSFPWWSLGARSNGMALGEPEPQTPPPQGMVGMVPPRFSSASWRGCSLGGWAVLSWQPQLQMWLQKLAAPGWEHDLMQARMWAPGLLLFSQCFFCSGITSARLEICPRLWGFGCLRYILSTQKERTIKEEENKHALFLKASSFPSVRILIDWRQKLKQNKKNLQNPDFNKIILFF